MIDNVTFLKYLENGVSCGATGMGEVNKFIKCDGFLAKRKLFHSNVIFKIKHFRFLLFYSWQKNENLTDRTRMRIYHVYHFSRPQNYFRQQNKASSVNAFDLKFQRNSAQLARIRSG